MSVVDTPSVVDTLSAVEIDPRFAQAWYNRGFVLNERGLAEDALNAFDNAIRLGYRSADLLEEKAIALEQMGADPFFALEVFNAELAASGAEKMAQRLRRSVNRIMG